MLVLKSLIRARRLRRERMPLPEDENFKEFLDLPTPKLIIFDCDGVLVDGETLAMNAIIDFAKEQGLDLTEEMAEKHALGLALPQVVKNLSKLAGKEFPADSVPRLRKMFIQLAEKYAEPVTGANALLKRLNDANIPFRIGSNSSAKEMAVKFRASGLEDHIEDDNIHSAADIGAPKPQPDVYLLAAEEEGVPPNECIVIEDSDPGALAAIRAGMRCIVLRPADQDEPPAFKKGVGVIAHSLKQVGDVIFKTLED
ncbi:HAD family phosphatase [Acetobacteraceae bacterium]|nr:HAD family phosphatase [Acetobacteraceae bacterium]